MLTLWHQYSHNAEYAPRAAFKRAFQAWSWNPSPQNTLQYLLLLDKQQLKMNCERERVTTTTKKEAGKQEMMPVGALNSWGASGWQFESFTYFFRFRSDPVPPTIYSKGGKKPHPASTKQQRMEHYPSVTFLVCHQFAPSERKWVSNEAIISIIVCLERLVERETVKDKTKQRQNKARKKNSGIKWWSQRFFCSSAHDSSYQYCYLIWQTHHKWGTTAVCPFWQFHKIIPDQQMRCHASQMQFTPMLRCDLSQEL